MQKGPVSAVLRNDLKKIFRVSWYQLGLVSLLIGVLLFLLNIFLGVGLYSNQFSDTLKDKLGMYFYIKDIPGQENEIYTKVIKLRDELKEVGIVSKFSSKDDAINFLQEKMPSVVGNFEKYGITNPLPATLYVMFKNDKQYDVLKTLILKYKDIILNTKDIDPGKSLQQQENRILTIINFTNFLKVITYGIIILLTIMILTFVAFLLRNIFDTFTYDFKLKKMLGAANQQITRDFTWLTLGVILSSFIICAVLLLITGSIANMYLHKLFALSVFDIIGNFGFVGLLYAGEIVVLLGVSLILAHYYIYALNRKT